MFLIFFLVCNYLIVSTTAKVCNFMGHPCELSSANNSYFTSLVYQSDQNFGDSWSLIQPQTTTRVSGRLFSNVMEPPNGLSKFCLNLRYSITQPGIVGLVIMVQSDTFHSKFCHRNKVQSNYDDNSMKKIALPFSMHPRTRIVIDVSIVGHNGNEFVLESFWIVRDDCLYGFKERMHNCEKPKKTIVIDLPKKRIDFPSTIPRLDYSVNKPDSSLTSTEQTYITTNGSTSPIRVAVTNTTEISSKKTGTFYSYITSSPSTTNFLSLHSLTTETPKKATKTITSTISKFTPTDSLRATTAPSVSTILNTVNNNSRNAYYAISPTNILATPDPVTKKYQGSTTTSSLDTILPSEFNAFNEFNSENYLSSSASPPIKKNGKNSKNPFQDQLEDDFKQLQLTPF